MGGGPSLYRHSFVPGVLVAFSIGMSLSGATQLFFYHQPWVLLSWRWDLLFLGAGLIFTVFVSLSAFVLFLQSILLSWIPCAWLKVLPHFCVCCCMHIMMAGKQPLSVSCFHLVPLLFRQNFEQTALFELQKCILDLHTNDILNCHISHREASMASIALV
jgi:hypothetical protein